MRAHQSKLPLLAIGVLLVAVAAQAQQAKPVMARAAPEQEPTAPALPPAAEPPAPATLAPGWAQRDGYVPVPDALLRPAASKEDPNALPPANPWSTIDPSKPFENDPLGTNVYSDTKYAPANVQAALDSQADSAADPTASVFAAPRNNGMAGGMTGGAAGGRSAGQAPMMPAEPAAGMPAPAVGNDVFTGGSNGFNNKYAPSVGNAIGSSDLLVQMIIEAPEQEVAIGSDAIRSLMGRMTNTLPNRIFVYQTRTINGANGQPSTSISYLIKNNLDAERSRQSATFGSRDIMNGFMLEVAKAAKLKILPGSIKVSSAVNDGGLSAGTAPAAGAMPGQMTGMMTGQMGMPTGAMPGQMTGMMFPAGAPAVAATPSPEAPAKSSANGCAAGVWSAVVVLLAAVVVL